MNSVKLYTETIKTSTISSITDESTFDQNTNRNTEFSVTDSLTTGQGTTNTSITKTHSVSANIDITTTMSTFNKEGTFVGSHTTEKHTASPVKDSTTYAQYFSDTSITETYSVSTNIDTTTTMMSTNKEGSSTDSHTSEEHTASSVTDGTTSAQGFTSTSSETAATTDEKVRSLVMCLYVWSNVVFPGTGISMN